MRGIYLLALIISISGLALIDYRLKLTLFTRTKQTIQIILISLIVFVAWDIIGIKLGIFFIGENNLLLGIRVGQFPIEEVLFLILLNYCSLITYLGIKKYKRIK